MMIKEVTNKPVNTVSIEGKEYVPLEDYVNALPSPEVGIIKINKKADAMEIARTLLDNIEKDTLRKVVSHLAVEVDEDISW